MNSKLVCAVAIAAFTAVPASAAVTVNFVQPDSFIDIPFDRSDRQRTLDDLTKHFETLAKQLPAGQDLSIEVIDIDLAGQMEPSARLTHDLRVMRGRADWPMIKLKYSVSLQGAVLKSGEERIADMNYMNRMNRYSSNESLRYEKRMLDEWFKKAFIAQ